MRKKNFKGRCEKRVVAKCVDVCRTYDPIQYAYANVLAADDTIQEFRCNVPMMIQNTLQTLYASRLVVI